jgi:hypothetical protein
MLLYFNKCKDKLKDVRIFFEKLGRKGIFFFTGERAPWYSNFFKYNIVFVSLSSLPWKPICNML